jgi:Mg-chelatase subunit ChlD
VEAQPFSYPFQDLKQQMNEFASGTTNIASAIDEAAKVLRKEKQRNIIVVMMTAGFADDSKEAERAAERFNKYRQEAQK